MPAAHFKAIEWAPHDHTVWAACADAQGFGLLCESSKPFVFHARDYVLEETLEHNSDQKIVHQNLVEFCIDSHFKPVAARQYRLLTLNVRKMSS